MLNFLLETIRLGINNLRLHKLRSLLTMSGIIIGIGSVIVMVAIGEGGKQAALEQIQQLGARNIVIRSIRPPESTMATGRTQRVLEYGIKRTDLDRLRTLPGIEKIVPLKDTEQPVIVGDQRAPQANAIGTTEDVFPVVNLRLARGELFTALHVERGETVAVIGSTVARQLFPFEDPLGKTVQIGTVGSATVLVTVIGVLEPVGLRAGTEGAAMLERDLDMDVYFPITVAQAVFKDTIMRRQAGTFERKQIELSEIWIQAGRIEDVEMISSQIENVLRATHLNLADITVKAPIQILRNAERLAKTFLLVMVTIALMALIVGGIGIMNIMLATVTERTREIGIRRALGAKQRHITLQFLVETTVVSLVGGLIGIFSGVSLAYALPFLVRSLGGGDQYNTAITMWSVIVSFGVSVIVGMVFGLYPAITAAKMNPIDALRHE